jgi:uncharacterized protein (DUF885 family)
MHPMMKRLDMPRVISVVFLIITLFVCGCGEIQTSTYPHEAPIDQVAFSPEESAEGGAAEIPSACIDDVLNGLNGLPLEDFIEKSYTQLLLRNPEYLSESGLTKLWGLRNDQLNDLSAEYIKDTQKLRSGILEILIGYDRTQMSWDHKNSLDVYQWYLDDLVRGHEFMYYNYPIHHFLMSYHDNLIRLFTELHPLTRIEDAEDYISRLSKVEDQIDQLVDGLQIREEMGIVPPDFILRMATDWMSDYIGMSASGSISLESRNLSVYTMFSEKLDEIVVMNENEREEFRKAALAEIEGSFIPAYVELLGYMADLAKVATPDAGVWKFPNGSEFYRYIIRHQTQTDMTPKEIHDLGLAEVDRITAEMYDIFEVLGYPEEDDFGDLIRRAASEGGYYDLTGQVQKEDYVAEIEATVNKVNQRLGTVFNIMPTADVIVIGDPESGGFYVPASKDGSRPGAYHAFVGMGRAMKYTMPTVAFHETNPGHHFQIAITQELEMPLMRTDVFFNGFVEGWALYAEMLAFEMGIYDDDPYGNLGRLQFELLRAVRLVTDTGIHEMRWSRDKAKRYMDEALGIPGRFSYEVDRYIVLPGQALGYKLGMLKIWGLREKAMIELGDNFDIKEFHRVVLGNGSVPLEVLENLVDEYIVAKGEG